MRALVMFCACVVATTAPIAQDDDAALDAHRAWAIDIAEDLARRGTARDAITAVYLGLAMAQSGGTPRASEVLRTAWTQAVAAGGDDPLVLTTAINACPTGPRGCERTAAFARLATLEPDNGAYWRLVLADALERGDAVRAREALANMARAERFDTHQSALFAALDRALATVSLPAAFRTDEDGALVEESLARGAFALGVLLSWTPPPIAPFAAYCAPGSDPAFESRREDCVAAADRMAQRADTLADEIVGARVRYRATPEGPARAGARAALRDVLWRRDEYARVAAEEASDPARAFATIERRRRHGSERASAEAALRAAGVPLTAPADFVPLDPDFRPPAAN